MLEQKPQQQRFMFKGWILTYVDNFNCNNSTSSCNSNNNNNIKSDIKWQPKYMIVDSHDKIIRLLNNEPSQPQQQNDVNEYFIDGYITKENFINNWKSKITNKNQLIELNLQQYDTTSTTSTTTTIGNSRELSPLREYITTNNNNNNLTNTHLTNSDNNIMHHRDDPIANSNSTLNSIVTSSTNGGGGVFSIASDDVSSTASISSTNTNNNNTTPALTQPSTSTSSTFRFADLFFKKSEKKSSLKRAKSGIQLERKKLNFTSNSQNQQQQQQQTNTNHQLPPQASVTNPNYKLTETTLTRPSLPTTIRPSRSHESLQTASSTTSEQQQQAHHGDSTLLLNGVVNNNNRSDDDDLDSNGLIYGEETIDNCLQIKINESSSSNSTHLFINTTHSSVINMDYCFEINDKSKKKRYFMCRTSEERDKWLFIIKNSLNTNNDLKRRYENQLQIWLLEAKGGGIVESNKKRYYCEIIINNCLYGRTSIKEKKEILFWGENFEFNTSSCDCIRVDLYQETVETKKKKKLETIKSSTQLLGCVYISTSQIETSQPVEKWYLIDQHDQQSNSTLTQSSTMSHLSSTFDGQSSSSVSLITSTSSNTTHNLNNSKDSVSLRIKAKYTNVDILPLSSYNKLIEYFKQNYLNLLKFIEPNISVRVKDDLSNTIVRLGYKLKFIDRLLCDLIIDEIMQIDDKGIIFRGNSIATKSIESYMKLIGDTYLKQTLSDIVRSIIETNVDLEIDPSKVSNQSNLQMNREELIQILYLVCGKVFNSCTYFPHELKQVFCLLRKMCINCGKTDEMCDMIISASVFLRFICPAILSPNLFNLTQEYPHEKAARKLTLAAKTLQTIANFSKFGGKEFYMSFDKMNNFVDGHTILMREFLRTISSESGVSRDECRSIDDREEIDASKTKTQFDCDYLIDLGKQLSILHSLLSSIIDTLDKTNVEKLGNLKEILNEIKELKSTNIGTTTATVNGLSDGSGDDNNSSSDIKINQKLLVINNLYHQAIQNTTTGIVSANHNNQIKPTTQQSEINQETTQSAAAFHENALDGDNIAAVALNQVNSVTNLIEQNLIIINKETETATSSSAESSTVDISSINNINNSDSQQTISPSYSSEATINFINVKVNKPQQLDSTTTTTTVNKNTTNEESSEIMKRLYETERELKREQQEKALIEYKYKQQEQEHNQQMKTLINRLIKVEEELHNEKLELHKLLKAKQEIIDLQKKRIEGLTNRLAFTQQQQQHHYYHYHTTNNNNANPKQHSSTNGKLQNSVIAKPYQSIQLTQSVNGPVELVDQYTTSLNDKKNNFSSSSSSSSSSSNTYLRTSEL